MLRKIVLIALVVVGLAGCSAVRNFTESPTPGLIPLPDGGHMQLFYSNPNYTQSLDTSVTGEYMVRPTEPAVRGGLGIMGQWHF